MPRRPHRHLQKRALAGARAEYSRAFMRLACAYLEGRDVGPVVPSSLAAPPAAPAGAAPAAPAASSDPDPSPGPPPAAALEAGGVAAAGRPPVAGAADSSTGAGAAAAVPAAELRELSARGALAAAHAGTRLPGSTTACVLQLNRAARTVCAANLVPPPATRPHTSVTHTKSDKLWRGSHGRSPREPASPTCSSALIPYALYPNPV